MSEDNGFNRDQKKEEERSILDFSGLMGKGMLAKEKKTILKKRSGLTPIGFGVDIPNRIMDRENSDQKRTGINFENVSSFGVQAIDEILGLKKKSVSLIDGLSNNEYLETLKNSSGLTPLNYDSEPPMHACKLRISPRRTLKAQSPGITNFSFRGE